MVVVWVVVVILTFGAGSDVELVVFVTG